MENYHPGEIVLVSFPFAGTEGAKWRPALVLIDMGDADIVVARVTSQIVRTAFDVEIGDWQQAGLLLPSAVRVHKLATLEKRLVVRRLGTLTTTDWTQMRATIQQLWTSI
ncbi:MAG: type II toxin-antitoxin system PemK/MazF family toxin [Methanophagales archaeon]|nr:type II toxin-antitoxin system PemK/MazF family toxin [Methanophagales archaeon]